MISGFSHTVLALAVLTMTLPVTARAAEGSLTETQKAEVRQVIKEYIRENPELIVSR